MVSQREGLGVDREAAGEQPSNHFSRCYNGGFFYG
jgi:hypothetical protein